MPKSAKKRKDKAADFSKSKLKLGKGKQAASNVIDTSFKARSIALPSQSIAVPKDFGAPTTTRRLTFDDLISQLKHYSANVRKDAILGLRELLNTHTGILDSCLTPLVTSTVRVIGDEDASVRRALLGFFGWLIPLIPKEELLPHSSSLLLFTTSAQTNIFPEIRIDAIRFLNLFLEYIPEAVVDGWDTNDKAHSGRILEGYLNILNAASQKNAENNELPKNTLTSIVLTPASKLVVFQSLSAFLQHATSGRRGSSHSKYSGQNTQLDAWFLEPSFSQREAFRGFERLLKSEPKHHSRIIWNEEADAMFEDFQQTHTLTRMIYEQRNLQEVFDPVDNSAQSTNAGTSQISDVQPIVHLAARLHSTLVSTFLDFAPSAFSPINMPSETEVNLVSSVVHVVRTLYGATLQTMENVPTAHLSNLQNILGYMVPYFPFHLTANDVKSGQTIQELNMIFCELASLFLLSNKRSSDGQTGTLRKRKIRRATSATDDKTAALASIVNDYIAQLLDREGGARIGQPLSVAAYIALLPTVWALINAPGSWNNPLQATIINHAIRVSSKASVKGVTVEFVARLVLLETDVQYQGNFKPGQDVILDKALEEWLLHLPKTLWELGDKNITTTEIILRALLRIVQRRLRLVSVKALTTLCAQLVPYFRISHAVRGVIPGPYSRLPLAACQVRTLALDLVATLLADAVATNRIRNHVFELSEAVNMAVVGTQEEGYWNRVKCISVNR